LLSMARHFYKQKKRKARIFRYGLFAF